MVFIPLHSDEISRIPCAHVRKDLPIIVSATRVPSQLVTLPTIYTKIKKRSMIHYATVYKKTISNPSIHTFVPLSE